jgi:hypothetical protein
MRKREDMLEVCRMISEQLEILGVREIRNVQTAIFYQDKSVYINYEYYQLHQKSLITEVDYRSHPIQENFANTMIEGKGEMVIEQLSGKEVIDWVEYQATTPQFVDPHLYHVSSLHYYWYSLGPIALGMSTYAPLGKDEMALFQRFRNVFDLAYRRYQDIEQAEAQAREAQIEAALERIRSRTMAMQKSNELKEVIQVVYDQFVLLKINIEHTGFIIDYKERDDMHIWLADIYVSPFQITIPYFDSPHWNSFVEAKDKGENFFSNLLDFEEKNKFYADLFKLIPGLPEESQQAIFSKPGLAISTVLLDNVGLYIENFAGIPYTDEENATLMRFGKVFQQTYTRFLDLQKAEAQAREAMIENALEKVRSRTMAMQHSDELQDAAIVLFQQIKSLDVETGSCGFNIWDKDKNSATVWMSSPEGGLQEPFKLMHTESEIYKDVMEAVRSRKNILVKEVSGEALKKHFDYLLTLPGIGTVIKELRNTNYLFPERMIYHFAFFDQGYLSFHLHASRPEIHDIFKRFANVFEQTYTRFIDLKKAEAQAIEAQIEAALEKVRSRSLAMHKSDELNEVIAIVFEKLKGLDIRFTAVGIGILIDGSKDFNSFICGENEAGLVLTNYRLPYFDHKIPNDINHAFEKQLDFFVGQYSKEEKDSFYEYVIDHTAEFRYLPEDIKRMIFESPSYSISMVAVKHAVFNINDFEGNTLSANDIDIIKRFARVFDQAYTRFLDLQKSESQTQKVKVEVALERVRARALAMQEPEELVEVAQVMRHEMGSVGHRRIGNQ